LRKYVGEYKQCDATNLALITSKSVEVELYRADGTVTLAMSDSQKGIPLEGISYIKIVGTHKLAFIEVIGDFRVTW